MSDERDDQVDDEVVRDETVDRPGRGDDVLHGDGSPGEPETLEQGLVRTGRMQPEHAPDEDSAGLTPEETARRVEHTHAQRDETHDIVTGEGHAADGDAPADTRS